MATLNEIQAELLAIEEKKANLEAQAAIALVPIYEAIAARLECEDVADIMNDIAELKSQLAEGSLPSEQTNNVIVVLTSVRQFFTDEASRLGELTAPLTYETPIHPDAQA